jgi:hypothetical protein
VRLQNSHLTTITKEEEKGDEDEDEDEELVKNQREKAIKHRSENRNGPKPGLNFGRTTDKTLIRILLKDDDCRQSTTCSAVINHLEPPHRGYLSKSSSYQPRLSLFLGAMSKFGVLIMGPAGAGKVSLSMAEALPWRVQCHFYATGLMDLCRQHSAQH